MSSAGYVTLTVYSPASFGFVVVYSFFPFTEYSTTGVVLLLDVDFTSTTSYPSYVLSNSFWVVALQGGTLTGVVGNDKVSIDMPKMGTVESSNAGENKAEVIQNLL